MKKKRTRQTTNLIDIQNSNSLGLKWRFYEFSIILQSASIKNPFFTILFDVLELFATIAPSVYVLTGNLDEYNNDESWPISVLYLWDIFQEFVPKFILCETWLYVESAFIAFTIVFFFICFLSPRQCYYFHIILNIQIHLVLFPLTSSAFSYDFMYLIFLPTNGAGLVPTILHLILFCIYFIILTFLYFAQSNSVIQSNIGAAQWFSMSPFHYPLLILFINFTGFELAILSPLARYLFLIATLILLISSAVYTFLHMPYIMFLTNEIYIAKLTVVSLMFILDVLILENILFHFRFVFFCSLPVIFFIFYFIYHFASNHRRISLLQIFTKLNDSDTFESLDASVKYASKMRSMVRICITSGNKIILSPNFINYCLERFPNDEWLISYVSFLYITIWNTTGDVYKFILHLLSLDTFNLSTEYTIYQFIYFFMQTSENISPVIVRNLDKYRKYVLKYVVAHRQFWMAAVERDNDAFNAANNQMGALMQKIELKIKQMEMLYPFCPAIQCERSLFEADLHHNYQKSDLYYQKAESLLDSSNSFINSVFFRQFSIFFPGLRMPSSLKKIINKHQQQHSSEYKYLSFFDQNDNALRSTVSLSINDPYLTSLTHTFQQPKGIPTIDPKFDTLTRRSFLFILFLFGLLSVGIFFFQVFFNRILNSVVRQYREMNQFLYDTAQFRVDMNIANFDMLLSMIAMNETIFNFSLVKLNGAHIGLLHYKSLYDNSAYKHHLIDIETKLGPGNCFQILFARLDSLILTFLSSSYNDNSGNRTQVNYVCSDLNNLTLKLYDEFLNTFQTSQRNNMKLVKKITISLLVLETIPPIIFAIIGIYLLKKNQNDIFDIVKTGQPPILNFIAHQFDKIISYEKSQFPEIRKYKRPTVRVQGFFIMLIYLVIDLLILIFCVLNKTTVFEKAQIPPLIHVDDTSLHVYQMMALAEIQREGYSIHQMFHHSIPDKSLVMTFYNYSPTMVAISKISFIFVAILLIWFIVNSFIIAKHWKIAKYCLKFIPSHFWHSNPIFHQLLREGKVKNSTVKRFMMQLKTEPSDFDFFVILQYDETGDITKITGNVTKFIQTVPTDLNELKFYFLSIFDSEKNEINEFFDLKMANSSLALSFPEGQDITITFSADPDCLIIKDNQMNSETNLKQKISRNIDDCLQNRRLFANTTIEKCILLLFKINDPKIMKVISLKSDHFESLKIIDSRYDEIIMISPVFENINPEFLDFLNTLRDELPEIKGLVIVGGPLMFFDAVKNALTKPRFVGEIYENAKIVLSQIKLGEVLIDKELSSLCNIEKDVVNMNAGLDKVIPFVSYFDG